MLTIPFITSLLKRREHRRLRRIMRGYRYLRQAGELDRFTLLKDALANVPLARCAAESSGRVFGAGSESAEIVVRQYLLLRVASVKLNKALLYALGKPGSVVVHYLPPEWRQVLAEHGFKIAGFRCAMAWNCYVALHLAYGALGMAKRTVQGIAALVRPSLPNLGRFAVLHGLAAGNLPLSRNVSKSYDILTWYLRWPGRVPLDTVCHTVKAVPAFTLDGVSVVTVPSAILPLVGIGAVFRYLRWAAAAIVIATADLFRGRWWHALILNEASSAAIVRNHDPAYLARDYLFHNSAWFFRPLWTYEAEQRGSRITFYFYSTNCESRKRPDGYPVQEHCWQAMNWPLYLVWNEYQAAFVRRSVGNRGRINVVGPIWFHGGTRDVPLLPPRSVAVFDVEPHRKSSYQVLVPPQEYFVPEVANQFLSDVHDAVSACGGTAVLKHKRRIGNQYNRSYTSVVRGLSQSADFLLIDPDVSALALIEKCIAVISMPFTSTALLGRELGKPSAFYDPSGMVQKGDRAAHGIELLSGRDELQAWMTSTLGLSRNKEDQHTIEGTETRSPDSRRAHAGDRSS